MLEILLLLVKGGANASGPSDEAMSQAMHKLVEIGGIPTEIAEWLGNQDREPPCKIRTEMLMPRQHMPKLTAAENSALLYLHDRELFTEEAWHLLRLQYIDLAFPPAANAQLSPCSVLSADNWLVRSSNRRWRISRLRKCNSGWTVCRLQAGQ